MADKGGVPDFSQGDSIKSEIALLHAAQEYRRELIDVRLAGSDAAVKLALAELNLRLEGMNEFRATIGDLIKALMTRQEVSAVLQGLETKLTSDYQALRAKIEERDKPNYVLAISIVSISIILFGGFWTVEGLKIDNAISPVTLGTEQLKTSQAGQDRQLAQQAELRQLQENRINELTEKVARAVYWIEFHHTSPPK